MTDTSKRIGTAGAAAMVAAGIVYGAYYIKAPGDDCPVWTCGANSAQVIGYAMQLDGEPNSDGYRITGFESRDEGGRSIRYTFDDKNAGFVGEHGQVGKLDVADSRFVIRGAENTIKPGEQLSKLVFERKGKKKYDITINDVQTVQSWAQPAGREPRLITSYLFESHLPGSTARKLCDKQSRWAAPDETPHITERATQKWHRGSFHAVLVAGDTYDTTRVRVNPGERWVDIACAGSALAKMKLLGYDPEVPAGDPLYTTREQRQTTLKMITATYCEAPQGQRFTENGTPLAWLDTRGLFMPPWDLVQGVEARWNESGATCLSDPRLLTRDRVTKICGELPLCPERVVPPAATSSYPLDGNEWASFKRREPSPDVLAKN